MQLLAPTSFKMPTWAIVGHRVLLWASMHFFPDNAQILLWALTIEQQAKKKTKKRLSSRERTKVGAQRTVHTDACARPGPVAYPVAAAANARENKVSFLRQRTIIEYIYIYIIYIWNNEIMTILYG